VGKSEAVSTFQQLYGLRTGKESNKRGKRQMSPILSQQQVGQAEMIRDDL